MLPLGCWIYPSLGSTVYYMETGPNNAFYVATWMLDLPELGKYSVLYGNRAYQRFLCCHLDVGSTRAWEEQCIIWKPGLTTLFMLPLGCWIYPSLGSTVYYMETGLNNAFYVATWMLDLPELGKYSVLYGNRA